MCSYWFSISELVSLYIHGCISIIALTRLLQIVDNFILSLILLSKMNLFRFTWIKFSEVFYNGLMLESSRWFRIVRFFLLNLHIGYISLWSDRKLFLFIFWLILGWLDVIVILTFRYSFLRIQLLNKQYGSLLI